MAQFVIACYYKEHAHKLFLISTNSQTNYCTFVNNW